MLKVVVKLQLDYERSEIRKQKCDCIIWKMINLKFDCVICVIINLKVDYVMWAGINLNLDYVKIVDHKYEDWKCKMRSSETSLCVERQDQLSFFLLAAIIVTILFITEKKVLPVSVLFFHLVKKFTWKILYA